MLRCDCWNCFIGPASFKSRFIVAEMSSMKLTLIKIAQHFCLCWRADTEFVTKKQKLIHSNLGANNKKKCEFSWFFIQFLPSAWWWVFIDELWADCKPFFCCCFVYLKSQVSSINRIRFLILYQHWMFFFWFTCFLHIKYITTTMINLNLKFFFQIKIESKIECYLLNNYKPTPNATIFFYDILSQNH